MLYNTTQGHLHSLLKRGEKSNQTSAESPTLTLTLPSLGLGFLTSVCSSAMFSSSHVTGRSSLTGPVLRILRNLTMEFDSRDPEKCTPESHATVHGTYFPVQPFPILVKGSLDPISMEMSYLSPPPHQPPSTPGTVFSLYGWDPSLPFSGCHQSYRMGQFCVLSDFQLSGTPTSEPPCLGRASSLRREGCFWGVSFVEVDVHSCPADKPVSSHYHRMVYDITSQATESFLW